MKKIIIFLLLVIMGLLSYIYLKENSQLFNYGAIPLSQEEYEKIPVSTVEHDGGQGEWHSPRPIEEVKKTCYQIGDGSYQLLDTIDFSDGKFGGVFLEVENFYCGSSLHELVCCKGSRAVPPGYDGNVYEQMSHSECIEKIEKSNRERIPGSSSYSVVSDSLCK